MKLDAAAARRVLQQDVAEPLGVGIDQAAELVCLTCDQAMVGAIEEITIKRGIDPRDYVMVAGGAAAGLHAVSIARELDIREVIVPRFAGVLSAFGILTSNIQHLFGRSLFVRTDRMDLVKLNATLAVLHADAKAYLDRMGVGESARRFEFTAEARYQGQIWQLTLPLKVLQFVDEAELTEMVEDFHREHERIYSVRSQNDAIELTELNVRAVGVLDDTELPVHEEAHRAPVPLEYRSAFFRGIGRVDRVPVFRSEHLVCGNTIPGPALIEEPLTTIVIPPGAIARVSRYGHYRIRI